MRILQISHSLPPESIGGVEQHVQGLGRALVARGHEVEFFARSSCEGPLGSLHEGALDGCRVTRVAYRWESVQTFADLYRVEALEAALHEFLERRRRAGITYDVAHVHHLTGLSIGCIEVLRRMDVRVVMTLHDYWMMCARGQMFHRDESACEGIDLARCTPCLSATWPGALPLDDAAPEQVRATLDATRTALLAVDQLVTPSARTIPFFSAFGIPARRIAVVENGVDTAALQQLAPPSADGPLRIGFLGTLIPSKGLEILTQAFPLAFAADPNLAELVVFGNRTPYHGQTDYFDRCLPGGLRAAWRGEYTTDDLPRVLGEIDVLVAPALWEEAFGLTVREAQAAGRPVVVSRIGGLQDAVTDGVEGRIVTPGDPAELASVLRELAVDRAGIRRMGRAARGRARGFAAMAADLLPHYRHGPEPDPATRTAAKLDRDPPDP